MRRFLWLSLALLLLAGVVVHQRIADDQAGAGPSTSETNATIAPVTAWVTARTSVRPNIVLIVTDDQRPETLEQLPTIQRELVRHGVVFTEAFVSNAQCCPSRATILTGRYSHSSSVYRNGPPFGGWTTFASGSGERETIAARLRAAGYRTALIGKYLNGYGGVFVNGHGATYVPSGWTRWVGMSALGYYDYTLTADGALVRYGARRHDYSTDVLAHYAVSFIRSTHDPFFLYFAPFAPHEPVIPAARHARRFARLSAWRPPSYDEEDVSDKPRYIRRLDPLGAKWRRVTDRYRRMQFRALLAVDDAVASMVKALRASGRLEDTMIVFTSDNGVAWGEHRLRGGSKEVPYDEATHVPLVVRYDPWTARPRTDPRLILNADFAPTFAALAGVRGWQSDGRSFVPLLRFETPVRWRGDFLLEHLRGQSGIPTYCGLRSERYLYVAYGTGEEELYDVVLDRDMLRNVAGKPRYERTLRGLRNRLRARLCVPPPPGFSWSKVLAKQDDSRHMTGNREVGRAQRPTGGAAR
jgi:N-acetylglucosamine-6-sulfatase